MTEALRTSRAEAAARMAVFLFSLGLTSCAVIPRSTPVPVEDRGDQSAPTAVETPGIPAELPGGPAPVFEPLPSPGPQGDTGRQGGQVSRPPAVIALLDRVDSAAASGNTAQAAAELERALRISPRDGELWLRLAKVRMQQRQWQQAEALALKCISLPESDAPTKRAAWNLIGSAREARGDAAGSAAARQRAAAIGAP